MTTDPRVTNAFNAMRALGISDRTVGLVLKRLLNLYGKKWELIEEENYRALADAIFEYEETKAFPWMPLSELVVYIPNLIPKQGIEEKKGTLEHVGSEFPNKREHAGQDISSREKRSRPVGAEKPDTPSVSCQNVSQGRTDSSSHFQYDQINYKRKVPASNPILKEESPSDGALSVASSQPRMQASSMSKQAKVLAANDSNKNFMTPQAKKLSSGVPHQALAPVVKLDNFPQQPVSSERRSRLLIDDITKGYEKVKVSVVDETEKESLPKFFYTPTNIAYQKAFVHISLARVADEDCCPCCSGDCLSSELPCACARETGGEFAYTRQGLLKEEFLKSCVSMPLEQPSQSHHYFYCEDCPTERSRNEHMPERCKGHLIRKFIKECWTKCGCNMECGNRVVQRGITRKLQVFSTGEGKGWGLRTLEALPKGAFVCEYVGEILTNTELYERNTKSSGNDRHTYPVLLDADWGSESVLEDESALCLDATYVGNIARFINHRCYDASLLEIPVEVETPDRHYYHLAFFTQREVTAMEELTWDYGIDFDDHNHPIKSFQCSCGSEYCRDVSAKRKGSGYAAKSKVSKTVMSHKNKKGREATFRTSS